MNRKIEIILSIPVSIYVNLRLFGIKGLKLPVYVNYKMRIGHLYKGNIVLPSDFCRGGIRIGFEGTNGIKGNDGHGMLDFSPTSRLEFKGKASFGHNATIRNYGNIVIGENFAINCNSFISVNTELIIGHDFMGAWNINIMDSDNHTVINDGVQAIGSGKITVGNHVWVCAYVDLLKNTFVNDDSIVGYKSLVNKKFDENKILIAGIPARIVRKDVTWQI